MSLICGHQRAYHPQVIYEHGERRWNCISGENLLIFPPEFSSNPTISHVETKQQEPGKKIMNLALRSIFVHSSKGFLTCRKILRNGAGGFTSIPKKSVMRILTALKIKRPRPGLTREPRAQ
jgi:hypothetical protein